MFGILLTAGCAAGDEATGLRAGPSGGDNTTSSLQDLPRRSPEDFPTPPIVDPTAVQRNDNGKDAGLGNLYWARWEIARPSLEGLGDPDHAELAVRRWEGILKAFDYERYPAVKQYADAAERDADCVMP